MTPGTDLPPEWWGDPFKAWSILDSGRQDDEHKRLAGDVAVIKEKLEGKQKQDLDAAHQKIRELQARKGTESEKLERQVENLQRKLLEKKLQNWVLTAIVSFIAYLVFQLAGAGFHRLIH